MKPRKWRHTPPPKGGGKIFEMREAGPPIYHVPMPTGPGVQPEPSDTINIRVVGPEDWIEGPLPDDEV